MKTDTWLALAAAAALLSFVVFAFRQGFKTKPTGRNTRDNVQDAIDLNRDQLPR
jgi:hypothetical protein